MKVPVTNWVSAKSVENGTDVIVSFVITSEYTQEGVFVKIEHMQGLDIPLGDVSLLHAISLCASFRIYGFSYC